MSDITVKMREYEPKKGQKTQRLTWRGMSWIAGDSKKVTKAAAEILTAMMATDGKPLFIVVTQEMKAKQVIEEPEPEPEPEPVEIEVDDSLEEEASTRSYSSKPKRKISRGRR